MKYHSVIKMKEVLSSAKTWVNLKAITLHEVSQSEKDNYVIPLTRGI